eukprot:TRINITY_DN4376_c0_g2_i1.p1 TRINITY_DN4376_c0_g2~~TRINITY_DN4376_c0_g2_i1.p1  ORF type:complete len:517 (+),score=106.27 TRINITY_DN4376_c0_g2_i1:159-1709(+)
MAGQYPACVYQGVCAPLPSVYPRAVYAADSPAGHAGAYPGHVYRPALPEPGGGAYPEALWGVGVSDIDSDGSDTAAPASPSARHASVVVRRLPTEDLSPIARNHSTPVHDAPKGGEGAGVGGGLLLAGWLTCHKQGVLNRSLKRWVALKASTLILYSKPSEEIGSYNLYLAKFKTQPNSLKFFISGAFLPKGCLEATVASKEDLERWEAAFAKAVAPTKDVKPSLSASPSNRNFAERQKLREEWLTKHLSYFYMSEADRSVDVPKVVQAFVFHELRLYMRMIGRYSSRAKELDFLLDPPEDTLPLSNDAFLKDDVAEVMWRYHWLEGHLASFFQQFDPDQRKEASRIAAVHLGREDMLRTSLLARYPGTDQETMFLLDAPTMDPQGWRYSTESMAFDANELGGSITQGAIGGLLDTGDGAGARDRALSCSPTTILPGAYERWTQSFALSQQHAHSSTQNAESPGRNRAKSVRFNLEIDSDTTRHVDPSTQSKAKRFRENGIAKSVRQLLRMKDSHS